MSTRTPEEEVRATEWFYGRVITIRTRLWLKLRDKGIFYVIGNQAEEDARYLNAARLALDPIVNFEETYLEDSDRQWAEKQPTGDRRVFWSWSEKA